ncbi:carbohydrate-binding family 9-like protein [Paenibacillus urinalis]|uniref:Carbohydrate-binding family 9-like protein n=1 Tax=Paenibacillus urinalis TaxID=521520 RepID=A0ABY7XBU9_9BACL|nr:carbohydrate-binding family 9-like protein [Paenibacillus urinalis]WDH99643.1 carbohydrate-binding family 9-like protein [Paenibacillus urinalis]WDI03276.1 carbohydrate-binding family 9-like protein [Paenibacillus urinalis]
MSLSGVPVPQIGAYEPKHYICQRAKGEATLDGRLDKPFWDRAAWTDKFVDIEGDIRPQPRQDTRVKMLWDDDYFYVGAELWEDSIWATLTERDSVIFYDNDFEIFIDPDGDSHGYYEFEINALNTVWDLLLIKPYRDGGPPLDSWDMKGLKTAVHIDGQLNNPEAVNRKWSVEVAIPWTSLKECAKEHRAPLPGEFWRVNFSRVEWKTEVVDGAYRKVIHPDTGKPYPEDNWVWSPMGLINMHYPELWGYVVFADDEGPDAFCISEDERIKWELRKLYYLQRNFAEQTGSYTEDLTRLGWSSELVIDPEVYAGERLFQITTAAADGSGTWIIREDGKLWKESYRI